MSQISHWSQLLALRRQWNSFCPAVVPIGHRDLQQVSLFGLARGTVVKKPGGGNAMLDTVIRGGRIVDGTGRAPFAGDVAVEDGKIVEIGRIAARGRDEIDADGALVTPGFIDIHTHYDGQFVWDSEIEPSFSNGVTTAVAG